MFYHEKNVEERARNAMEFRETGHERPVLAQAETSDSQLSPAATSPTPTPTLTRKRPLPSNPPSVPVPEKYICYLCSRQFNTTDMLSRHEQLSELHKKNLAAVEAQKGLMVIDGATTGSEQHIPP
eukprot:Platyproteum_vivax@DN5592_c0_g1_i3.p1